MTTNVVPNQSEIVNGRLVMARNGAAITFGGVESFDSSVLIGPIPVTDPTRFGRLRNIQATIAAGSSLFSNQ